MMRRCRALAQQSRPFLAPARRRLSTAPPSHHVDRVEVRCGSSGNITVDLHNVFQYPSSAPLLIYLPPFAPAPESPPALPPFLQQYPTAVINYRWAASPGRPVVKTDPFVTPLHWPTPIHDALFGYSWIMENLAPAENGRKDLYVYGSCLGASLAASMALTESHSHERMAVRGFAAYNGIYNWTMFLPDHKANQPSISRAGRRTEVPQPAEGTSLHYLSERMPGLFQTPANLFDPFASPSLLFQTAGLLIPPTFSQPATVSALIDSLSSMSLDGAPNLPDPSPFKTPRRSSLIFPPRKSTLKIPPALLLHDTAQSAPPARRRQTSGAAAGAASRPRKPKGNSFERQALELAGLMRRSVEKLELKDRRMWDEDIGDLEAEAERRVGVCDIGAGESEGGMQLNGLGEDVVRGWLEERIRL